MQRFFIILTIIFVAVVTTATPTATSFPIATLEALVASYNPGETLTSIPTGVKLSPTDEMIEGYIPKGSFIMGTNDKSFPARVPAPIF